MVVRVVVVVVPWPWCEVVGTPTHIRILYLQLITHNKYYSTTIPRSTISRVPPPTFASRT